LYNLYNPSYLSNGGINYRFYKPEELCERDIDNVGKKLEKIKLSNIYELFVESDQKTFIASNSITGRGEDPSNTNLALQNPYVIANDNDIGQSPPYSIADVNYIAGNEINLHAGFEVHVGANFRAKINTSLVEFECPNGHSPLLITNNSNQTEESTNKYKVLGEKEENEIFDKLYQEEKEKVTNFQNQVAKLNLGSTIYTFEIKPNPNNGTFTINKSINDGVTFGVTVIDILGNVVGIWKTSESKLEVNVNEQAAGVYFVKIVSEEKTTMQKIIKQ
jgi:hypothetical protein